jgi:predicted  nucleic acid-binding Zn-ribbon protein
MYPSTAATTNESWSKEFAAACKSYHKEQHKLSGQYVTMSHKITSLKKNNAALQTQIVDLNVTVAAQAKQLAELDAKVAALVAGRNSKL